MAEFKLFPSGFSKFIHECESVWGTRLHDLEKKLLQEQNLLAIEIVLPQGKKLQYLTFLLKNKKVLH